jgi:hypothetical protein
MRHRGAVAASIAFASVTAALTSASAAAPGGSDLAGDIAQLRTKGCATYRAPFERHYSPAEIAAARHDRFTIYRGLQTKLVAPVNWNKNPYGRRGFRASLQTLKFLEVLFYAYRQGSDAALRQAKALALDWVRDNPGPSSSSSSLAWFNKTVGERAPYLSYLVRAAACEHMLSGRQLRVLVGAVRTTGAWLADPANYYPSNHGLFMDLGLLVLSDHYFPFIDGAQRWEATARSRFPRTLAGRVSREGAWLEQSFGYHFLVMDLARRFLQLGGGSGRVRHLLRRMTSAAAWFVEPDGRLAQIGDTDLDRAPAAVRRRSRHLDGMKVMRQAGFVFVRHRDSYLAVAADFHNTSHKQSDEGTFELAEGGVRVVTGPGKYGYDRDRHRRYVVSARSHSVLTVDGRGFPRDPSLEYGSGVEATRRRNGWYVLVVHNPLLRQRGVEHQRVFLYKPGRTLVIEDGVQASAPHRYRRFLQLGPEIGIERVDPTRVSLHGGGFHACVEDARYGGGVLATRSAVRGGHRPYQGWTFPQVATPVPRWTLSYSSRGQDVSHALVIDLEHGCRESGAPVDEVVDQANNIFTSILGAVFPAPQQPPPPSGP